MIGFGKVLERIKIYFELFLRSDKKRIIYTLKRHELNVIDGFYYVNIHYQLIGSRVMRTAHADKMLLQKGYFALFSPEDAEIILTLGVATSFINLKSKELMVDKLINYVNSFQKISAK